MVARSGRLYGSELVLYSAGFTPSPASRHLFGEHPSELARVDTALREG